jgi:serine/threonine protein kinase
MTATTVLPKPGDHLAGKYFIESQLGGGRSSVVFGATDLATSRRYAIRWWVSADAASAAVTTEQFIRTARASRLFDQPGLAQTYRVAKTSSGAFFAITEWLDGYTLEYAMQRGGQLPLLAICNYLLPCMQAVAAAHDIGIVHADLRPAKVFVSHATKGRAERACILDFVAGERWRRGCTLDAREFAMLGSEVAYLAPEQVRDGTIDPRSDVYAFGVILYRALAGRLPFDMRRIETVPDQILQGALKPLRISAPGLPRGIVEIVTRAMALDPAERYQDLPAFALELDRFCLHTESEEAPFVWIKSAAAIAPLLSVESTTMRMQRMPAKRPPPRRSASYLAVLALLGAGVFLYWRAQTSLTQSNAASDLQADANSDVLNPLPSAAREPRGLAPGAVALEAVNAPDQAPTHRERAAEAGPSQPGGPDLLAAESGSVSARGERSTNAAANSENGSKRSAAVSGGPVSPASAQAPSEHRAEPKNPGLEGADGNDSSASHTSANVAVAPAAAPHGRFGVAPLEPVPAASASEATVAAPASTPVAPEAPVPAATDEADPLDQMTLQ